MKKLNPDYVKAVTAMANDSPYFRHLGMAITELGVGEALVEIRARRSTGRSSGTFTAV